MTVTGLAEELTDSVVPGLGQSVASAVGPHCCQPRGGETVTHVTAIQGLCQEIL